MIRAMLISATLQVPVLETINAIHWLVKSFTIHHTRSHILYSGQLRVTLQVWIKIKMLANQIQTSINKYLKTVYCLLGIVSYRSDAHTCILYQVELVLIGFKLFHEICKQQKHKHTHGLDFVYKGDLSSI